MKIRLSYGTAVKMGLKSGKMQAEPTTAYIMLGERCISNCLFCAQRREARREGYLSRVLWPEYDEEVLRDIRNFTRICFQTLDYQGVVDDLLHLIPLLPKLPISVSIVPISRDDMLLLRDVGVELISIALDAANQEVFDRVKGSGVGNRFTWDGHWNALMEARKIFGTANTHLIVGLGESDEDLYNVMVRLYSLNISVALFAYTPIFGGFPPPVERYRAIQLVRFLIFRGYKNFVSFEKGNIRSIEIPYREMNVILKGVPFLTSGCPGCNRPFYNERPGGTIYNYPELGGMNVDSIIGQIERYTELIWP